jgi:DNA-binding MarR family transcriptional regulator
MSAETDKIPFHKWFSFYDLLVAIKLNPEANISKLAKVLGRDRSAVTRLVTRAYERDLVDTRRVIGRQNRSEKRCSLTELGEKFLTVFGLSLSGIAEARLGAVSKEIELLEREKELLRALS